MDCPVGTSCSGGSTGAKNGAQKGTAEHRGFLTLAFLLIADGFPFKSANR